ncbi:formate dehydrogenase family accessory protein FdhD [Catenulispora acidiphila DSM 44928]|uniref:Sulfur carrier protein FdhD n=1 Tax=Catenulispora acidiphila (strain DSM 44928 / JCM 14897 / NBRC 102108 / NRRL B-24433 / ID139908) TaxID=479433 RepID=C7Q2C1_CATAD|nr:formate dehydrogenase accessory sulfurtransferase FdhD [Catenulispora acidiphila]ACU69763.1 formate dehydrogenase family accessory protein FdhD [Catenulispora acidiphila DSM 44928]
MSRVTARRRIVRLDGSAGPAEAVLRRGGEEHMAAEEPLEMRIGGHPFTVTMRTPGDDFDLVAGHLTAEGVLSGPDDLLRMKFCSADNGCSSTAYTDGEASLAFADGDPLNIVDVTLAPGVELPEERLRRSSYVTSACGVCGKTSIDAVHAAVRWPVAEDDVKLSAEVLFTLPDRMREAQKIFAKTGGLHAAALFTATGDLLCLREDVGRHNAVDKVLGWALRAGRLPLREHVLAVSGRASFELVQKAVAGGIPVLTAVSAPSSLAVSLAAESGLTLVGFLRGRTANVYCGSERVID